MEKVLKFDEDIYKAPYVKVKIKGEIFRFLIDTGADSTSLSTRVMRNMELTREQISQIKARMSEGVGGYAVSSVVKIEFKFCGVSIPRVAIATYLSTDLDSFRPTHALIGQDILQKFRSYTIDNLHRTITFRV